ARRRLRRVLLRPAHRDRQQRGTDGQFGALLAEAGGDHTAVGAGHLDHRLGRLDLDDRLVDGDDVADLDQPAHDLRLGEPLTEVGQLELQHLCHQLSASHCRRPTASRIRSTPGRWWRSSIGGGYGRSNPATRSTGASRWWKQRSVTRAAISPPGPPKPPDSWTTTARPVRRTEAHTVSSSNGTSDRRSTTSRSHPSARAASAASMQTGTDGP